MSRLVPFTLRANTATKGGSGPRRTVGVRNVRVTENITPQRSPDPIRDGDFNTRASRYQFYHGGSNGSHHILREGFERSTVRPGFERVSAMQTGIVFGYMSPFVNPSGNQPDLAYQNWGTFLDNYQNGSL